MAEDQRGISKPRGRPFPKGASGNTKGRPKDLLPSIKDLAPKEKRLDAQALKNMIIDHFGKKSEELADILTDPDAPALSKIIAKGITMAFEDGHMDKAEYLFRRAYGAVPQQLKVTASIKGLSAEEKIARGKEAIAFIEATRLEESKTIEGEIISE